MNVAPIKRCTRVSPTDRPAERNPLPKKTRAQNTARLRRVSQSVGDVMLSFPPWGKLFRGKRVEPHSTTIITTFPPPSIRFQWVLYYCFHTLGGPYWLYYENKVTNQGEHRITTRGGGAILWHRKGTNCKKSTPTQRTPIASFHSKAAKLFISAMPLWWGVLSNSIFRNLSRDLP